MVILHGNIAVGLEDHQSKRPARLHVSKDKFGKYTQAKLVVGDGLNDPNSKREDRRDEDSDTKCPPGKSGMEGKHGDEA